MSEIQWTESQKNAITAKDTSLLVSASAGSGKSTLMVERIIRRITDFDNPVDIDKIVIVTFTVAATEELKIKIKKKLNELIAKNPKNKYLRSQLANLPNATIKTINSFCYSIVRENFSILGVSPSVRIVDENEENDLELRALADTIEYFYSTGKESGIDDFAYFCSNYSGLKDNSLENIFKKIYNDISSCVQGLNILLENADELDAIDKGGDVFESKWGRVIKEHTLSLLESIDGALYEDSEEIHGDIGLSTKYAKKIDSVISVFEQTKEAIDIGFREVSSIFPVKFAAKGTKGTKDDNIDARLDLYVDVFSKIQKLYSYSNEDSFYFARKSAQLNRDLYTFLAKFEEKLKSKKQKRGVISFNDCERMAVNALCSNGEPTELAEQYRCKYVEVYIDEYQDVNPMQDTIFNMIARNNGKFIVGDIKQSIYLFRSAAPGLFDFYRNEYIDYKKDEIEQDKPNKSRIFLSENFRSSENVVKFSNLVASNLFIKGKSEIAYYDGDNLVFKKSKKDRFDDEPITLRFFDKNEGTPYEALYVADEIEKLVNQGEGLKDIAVLVRNHSHGDDLAAELKKRGIPVGLKSNNSFLDLPEIQLTLCYLNTIDNPRKDLYVFGIMNSPVYGFSVDEIEKIRKSVKFGTLFEAVRHYSIENDYEKGKAFVCDIDNFRDYSRKNTADKVLWKLYYEKGLLNILTTAAKRKAKNTRKNLLTLFEYCKTFENGDFKGLYDFMRYIESITESGVILHAVSASDAGENSVKFITIHSSKGLEFKYCFLYGMGKKFRSSDGEILFHSDIGVFSRISDNSALARYDSIFLNSLRVKKNCESRDECIRLLYVALTRAKSRLWVTGTVYGNTKLDKMISKYELYSSMLSRYLIDYENDYSVWIWSIVEANKNLDFIDSGYVYEYTENAVYNTEAEEDIEKITSVEVNNTILENCKYEYAYKDVADIPAKISVSRLYPDALDEGATEYKFDYRDIKMPFFADGKSNELSAKRGSATHLFMQFCDFDNVCNNGVENELIRLTERGFFSEKDAVLVYIDEIKAFFSSDLFKQMRKSSMLYREKRFNVNLPAADFSLENKDKLQDEQVLVQGVIDCFFYDENGDIVLVDYKTDRKVESIEKTIEMLRERHSEQLGYYNKAIEIITADKVSRKIIYSFSLGEAIEI